MLASQTLCEMHVNVEGEKYIIIIIIIIPVRGNFLLCFCSNRNPGGSDRKIYLRKKLDCRAVNIDWL